MEEVMLAGSRRDLPPQLRRATEVTLLGAAGLCVAMLSVIAVLAISPSCAHATTGSWSPQVADAPFGLSSVDFVDASNGWAVGWGHNSDAPGTILATEDGGAHWVSQDPGVGAALVSVDFVDSKHGWVTGSWRVLSTADGGAHWRERNRPGIGIQSLKFVDSQIGWAVGDGIAKTTDGGESWVTQMYEPNRMILSADFSDPLHGWAVGFDQPDGYRTACKPVILVTSDGGENWTVQYSDYSELANWQLQSVSFVDSQRGWAVGNNGWIGGIILSTSDGGAHWSIQRVYDYFNLRAVSFADSQHGWVIGTSSADVNPGPLILATDDGGLSWSRQPVPGVPAETSYLTGVAVADSSHAWTVASEGQILRYDADPVPQPTGDNAPAAKQTQLPVIVLVAGLSSNSDAQHPDIWGGVRKEILKRKLAADVLIAPTGQNAAAADTIDSEGNLYTNVHRLKTWLAEPETKDAIGTRPVIFVCHSYGGLITRGLLSMSRALDYTGLAEQIAGVVQIASPNGGSWLADTIRGDAANPLWNATPLWLYKPTNAITSLTPHSMAEFNGSFKNSRKYTIHRIGGSYIPDSFTDYPPEWGNDTNAAILAAQKFLYDEMGQSDNDGVVSIDSLSTGGVDYGGGVAITHHATHGSIVPGSRENPFYAYIQRGLFGPIEKVSLKGEDPQIVPQMTEPEDTAIFNTLSGMIQELKYYWKPTADNVSRSSIRSAAAPIDEVPPRLLPPRTVTVTDSESVPVSVSLDSTTTLVLASAQATPTVSVTGATIETVLRLAAEDGVRQTLLTLVPNAPGQVVLQVGLEGSAAGDVSLSGSSEDGTLLRLEASKGSGVLSDAFGLTATLVDGGSPVIGANVNVTAVSGWSSQLLALADDGVAPDVAADDGVYAATFAPPVAGTWSLRADAMSATFERASSTVLSVGDTSWASFDAPLQEATETTTGGKIARWGVRAPIAVSEPGEYTFTCDILDSAGTLIAQAAAGAALSAETTTLAAWVDGRAFEGMRDGSVLVRNARLTRLTDDGELLAGTTEVLEVGPYSSSDFFSFGIQLPPLTPDPSPTGGVTLEGTAVYTPGSIAAVEYSLDGAATWQAASPIDGDFDSAHEPFTVALSLADGAYGLLVRATASDGTMLSPEAWVGDRFIVDSTAPLAVGSLAAISGDGAFTATWSASEAPSLSSSSVTYEVTLDGVEVGTTSEASFEGKLPDDAEHTVSVTPLDEAGNIGPSCTVNLGVSGPTDPVAPTTSLSIDPAPNGFGWNNSAVMASLAATDGPAGSGVARIDYQLGWGSVQSYSAALTVSADGVHSLHYAAVDHSGNREATQTAAIRIDTSAPSTICDAKSLYLGPATIVLSATDTVSGIESSDYRVDGGGWQNGSTVSISAPGIHTLQYRSGDRAGNVEIAKSAVFTVVAQAPPTPVPVQATTALALTSKSNSSLKYGATFTVAGTLTSEGAGLSGLQAVLQSAAPGKPFADVASATTNASGGFFFSVKPMSKTSYRVRFGGTTSYAACGPTAAVIVTPKVSLHTPVAPKTMRSSRSYTIYGLLKPGHKMSSKPVRIYKYKKVGKKWKPMSYVRATAVNYKGYTRYSVKMRLTSKGTWRLRACAPADSLHAETWSAKYDTVTVR